MRTSKFTDKFEEADMTVDASPDSRFLNQTPKPTEGFDSISNAVNDDQQTRPAAKEAVAFVPANSNPALFSEPILNPACIGTASRYPNFPILLYKS